jgi:hypothetical protein
LIINNIVIFLNKLQSTKDEGGGGGEEGKSERKKTDYGSQDSK